MPPYPLSSFVFTLSNKVCYLINLNYILDLEAVGCLKSVGKGGNEVCSLLLTMTVDSVLREKR